MQLTLYQFCEDSYTVIKAIFTYHKSYTFASNELVID